MALFFRICWIQPSYKWHIQRVTALVMLPLWLSLQSTVTSVLIAILPIHFLMGLHEVFEDYVFNDTAKALFIWLVSLLVGLTVKILYFSIVC